MANITKTLEGLGRQVQYFPGFARCFGDVKAAIFLGQLLYWWPKRSGDSIYKTAEEWEEETGLSEKEQRRAREILKRFQILTDEYHRLEHRMHYFLNEEMLDKVWNEYSRTDKRDVPELTIGQFGKDPNGSSSINTKLQQEITTLDSTAPTALAPKQPPPLKDPVAQQWEQRLTSIQPMDTWANVGKERRDCTLLAKRATNMLAQSPYTDMSALIDAVLNGYAKLRDDAKANDSYWRTAPYTPSAILSRWAAIWTHLAEQSKRQEALDNIGDIWA